MSDVIPTTWEAGVDWRQPEAALLGTITVTYNPDLAILKRQLSQIPGPALKVVVDNASSPELKDGLARVTELCGAILLLNGANVGLPAALNQGCRYAQCVRPACRHLLLLDQDSEPEAGAIERLILRYGQIAALSERACCIGPRLVDIETALEHGFHQIRGARWVRSFPPSTSQTPIPLANLNGSGTLMPVEVFNELGGLEEDFFIDHVDTEWAFRVLAAGYGLYGVPDVTFGHRMGDKTLKFWLLRWRVWPYRSPQRHYFLFRNAVRLMRRGYIPSVWKVWAVMKLGITLFVHMLFDRQRSTQVRSMAKGVRDGWH